MLTCAECGCVDETVHERSCVYAEEVSGESFIEVVCDDCEREHAMDI